MRVYVLGVCVCNVVCMCVFVCLFTYIKGVVEIQSPFTI